MSNVIEKVSGETESDNESGVKLKRGNAQLNDSIIPSKTDNSKPSSSEFQNLLLLKKLNHLNKEINTNRIFMNMVIHDMRNPTTSIEFGVDESLKQLQQHLQLFNQLKEKIMRISSDKTSEMSLKYSI